MVLDNLLFRVQVRGNSCISAVQMNELMVSALAEQKSLDLDVTLDVVASIAQSDAHCDGNASMKHELLSRWKLQMQKALKLLRFLHIFALLHAL